MRRGFSIIAVLATCLTLNIVQGQDTPASKKATAEAADKTPLNKLTFADLEKRILENPADRTAINRFITKINAEVPPLVRQQPDDAAERLEAMQSAAGKITEAVTDVALKKKLEETKKKLDHNLQRMAASRPQPKNTKDSDTEKVPDVIGKKAAPLNIERWVNGSPLTDDQLKGKVVLLDFWAVWCGPCIATFPHLREWNQMYGDRGLVIVGLTHYYNYEWDQSQNKATKSTEKVPHEQEQAMLAMFAKAHGLTHRLALTADGSLSDFYGVKGIPHVVLIDRKGTVRYMRVGSSEQGAAEIGQMIAQLLAGG